MTGLSRVAVLSNLRRLGFLVQLSEQPQKTGLSGVAVLSRLGFLVQLSEQPQKSGLSGVAVLSNLRRLGFLV